jgi:hypothetical protein
MRALFDDIHDFLILVYVVGTDEHSPVSYLIPRQRFR